MVAFMFGGRGGSEGRVLKRFNDDANIHHFVLVLEFFRLTTSRLPTFENEDDDENEYEGATYFTGPTES